MYCNLIKISGNENEQFVVLNIGAEFSKFIERI